MEKKKSLIWTFVAVVFSAVIFTPAAFADDGVPMFRMYNPNSGEHFYSSSLEERNSLIHAGWRYEGAGWNAPTSGDPVYRLYNANGGEHHYTLDASERDALVAAGWNDEGVGWRSGGALSVYRQYNPNAFSCNHNYTVSEDENDGLFSAGWREEGVAWRGCAPPSHDECFTTIATDYYRVDIPKDWPTPGANLDPHVDNKQGSGGSSFGWGVRVNVGGNALLHISCFEGSMGPQLTDAVINAIGTPSNKPGWTVKAYTSDSSYGSPYYLDEFVSFVTLC